MTLLAVYTTVASMEDARRLADVALAERLAACVQPSATESHFRWSGHAQGEEEARLLFKTEASRHRELERCLREHHPYELPATFALAVAEASARYAASVEQEVSPPGKVAK